MQGAYALDTRGSWTGTYRVDSGQLTISGDNAPVIRVLRDAVTETEPDETIAFHVDAGSSVGMATYSITLRDADPATTTVTADPAGSSGQIRVTWNQPHYAQDRVRWHESGTDPSTALTGIVTMAGGFTITTTPTYTQKSGTRYDVWVEANGFTRGEATVVTQPAAPTGLTVTAGDVPGSLTAAWDAVTTGPGVGVTYEVEHELDAADDDTAWASAGVTVDRVARTAVITELDAATAYRVRVRAVATSTETGEEALRSVSDPTVVTVTAPAGYGLTVSADPAAVTEGGFLDVTVSLPDEAAGNVTGAVPLTWSTAGLLPNPAGDEDRDIGTGSGEIPAGDTSITLRISAVQDARDETDESFVFTVALGENPPDNVRLLVPSITLTITDDDTLPAAPANLAATGRNEEVVLTWDALMDTARGVLNGRALTVTRYEYRQADSEANLATATWTSTRSSNPEYVVTGLTNGTEYFFQVRAVTSGAVETAEGVAGNPASASASATAMDVTPMLSQVSIPALEFARGQMVDHQLPPATGGDPPLTYTLEEPPADTKTLSEKLRGLRFDPATRTLRGTVDRNAFYGEEFFVYRVTDADGDSHPFQSVRGFNIRILEDYDADDDGLIEISNLEQLNAVRWDLDGNGMVTDDANTADVDEEEAYAAAFPTPQTALGCADTDTDGDPGPCTGYELAADLDFDDAASYAADTTNDDWSDPDESGEGWAPIGDSSNRFETTFDGNGHTISNLFINRAGGLQGLFATIGNSGEVRGLRLVGVSVASTGSSNIEVGGLAGWSTGLVTRSSVSGTVSGEGNEVGGLVGANHGTVSYSHSSATVTGAAQDVGGLVGKVHAAGRVIAGYATGPVSGAQSLGGLVGRNEGTIIAGYAHGSVTGTTAPGINAGGLVGWNQGTVNAGYATGLVRGRIAPDRIAGLVGNNIAGGTVSNAYFDTGTSGPDRRRPRPRRAHQRIGQDHRRAADAHGLRHGRGHLRRVGRGPGQRRRRRRPHHRRGRLLGLRHEQAVPGAQGGLQWRRHGHVAGVRRPAPPGPAGHGELQRRAGAPELERRAKLSLRALLRPTRRRDGQGPQHEQQLQRHGPRR